jgi:long-chain acyl-CoA synthetase
MRAPEALDIPSLLTRLYVHGRRTALSFFRGKALDGRLSYAELSVRAECLAAYLHVDLGVRPGDRVAILTPNRLEVPILVLALLRLGAIVVPLNPGSAVDDWGYILQHSGASGICATRDLYARIPEGARPAFSLNIEDVLAVSSDARTGPTPIGLEEHVGLVLYTSGTTGSPKGVALRQRNLLYNAWSMAENFHVREATQLAVLPLYHAHAFGFGLMTALSTGGHLVFTERMEPFTWADVVRSEAVTVASVVPTLLPMLLAAGVTRDKVPTLRHIMVSSAPLPAELAKDFTARAGIPLIQGWGLSEYTNFACCVSPDEPADERSKLMFAWEVPSIGPALEGTEVLVVDDSGEAAEEGARGELTVRGHSTMAGYFRDEENTARTLGADGWLRTGDEGFFRTHRGRPIFFVTGRLKEIIIRDGEKFSPLRIEQRLLEALPELFGRLVVLGFPNRTHGEEVGAYLEIKVLDDALREKLATVIRALPVAERPKVLLHGARSICRTHTGKVQRRKMQPWFEPWILHMGAMVIAELDDKSLVSS